MTPIPSEELKQYINKPIIMRSESNRATIRIKEIKGKTIRGVNMTRSCLFEVTNIDLVKFYTL
jgi:hypothetical protein